MLSKQLTKQLYLKTTTKIFLYLSQSDQDQTAILKSEKNTLKKIINRIENKTGQIIKDKILLKESFCVNDFKQRYNAFDGNAYGLANTLLQTAVFKPKIKDLKVKNLFYTGHFTVPGLPPPAIISGKIVSELIIKDFK